MPFEERQRNLFGQALTSIAAGLLFLKYFSGELRFVIVGFLIVVLSCLFLAAALGLVVGRLNRVRNFTLQYGSNVWFALMIISLARVLVSAIGVPNAEIPFWVGTAVLWVGVIWFLIFAAVFITLSWFEIAAQFRRDGARRGTASLLVSIAWVFGVFSVLLMIMTDLDIRYGIVMLGIAVVALATRLLNLRTA